MRTYPKRIGVSFSSTWQVTSHSDFCTILQMPRNETIIYESCLIIFNITLNLSQWIISSFINASIALITVSFSMAAATRSLSFTYLSISLPLSWRPSLTLISNFIHFFWVKSLYNFIWILKAIFIAKPQEGVVGVHTISTSTYLRN